MSKRPMSAIVAVIVSLMAVSLAGCGEPGSGIYYEETRQPEPFDQIVVHGDFDLIEISICDCSTIKITGDDNIVPGVQADAREGRLTLDSPEWYDPELPLQVHIQTPDLSELELNGDSRVRLKGMRGGDLDVVLRGSSDVELEGLVERLSLDSSGSADVTIERLKARELTFELSGSGDIDAHGETDRLEIISSGSTDIDAERLEAKDVVVTTSGSSDVTVCALESLDASISGSGDVTYFCGPGRVTRKISGSGDLDRR